MFSNGFGSRIKLTANTGSEIKGDIIASQGGKVDASLTGGLLVGNAQTAAEWKNKADDTKDLAQNNLILANSKWIATLTEPEVGSRVNVLKLTDSLVKFAHDENPINSTNIIKGIGGTLDVYNELTAKDSTFRLNIIPNVDVSKTTDELGYANRIDVYGTFKGSALLDLNNVGGMPDVKNKREGIGTVLARVKDGDGKFVAKEGVGSLYHMRYILATREATDDNFKTDWYLADIIPLNTTTPLLDTVNSQLASTYYGLLDNIKLMQRMGELRHNKYIDLPNNLWARFDQKRSKRSGEFNYRDRQRTFEFGIDRMVQHNTDWDRWLGISASLGDGESTYLTGSGKNYTKALSIYFVGEQANGWYYDAWAKITRNKARYSIDDETQSLYQSEFTQWGTTLNLEVGKRFWSKEHRYFIEPQGQITGVWVRSDDQNVTQTKQDEAAKSIKIVSTTKPGVLGRLGANFGWNVNPNSELYGKFNVLHVFSGRYDNHFVAPEEERFTNGNFKTTWVQYGVGVSTVYKEKMHLYADIERNQGKGGNSSWRWNIGARYNF